MAQRRRLIRGAELPWGTKLLNGLAPVVLLVLTLVGPLIYFSDINVRHPQARSAVSPRHPTSIHARHHSHTPRPTPHFSYINLLHAHSH
jgi:hypothetical protein